MWAYDFMQLRTQDGRGVRLLTVMDEYSRECLAIRAECHMRSDNGPEFTARAVREWLGDVGARAL